MKTLVALSMGMLLCLPGGNAFARDVNGANVTIVHSGETPTAHAGKQCHFKVQGSNTWFVIKQGRAGEFNCSIALSAFETGRQISFDHVNSEVKHLCVAVGNC